MARRKPADTVHLRLRFPEKLRRRIEAAADKNQQSMNAEIVERLEQSFQKEDGLVRDRELVKEAVAATISGLDWERHESARLREWQEEWERRLTVLDGLREQAIREQASAATNEQTKSQEGDVVNLMDALKRQVQAEEQASAATSKETKKRSTPS